MLVGQLLPVTIMAEGALMVPTISRAAQDNYQQDVWLYSGINRLQPVSFDYTLGTSAQMQDITINAPPVATLSPLLITKSVYRDRADVIVAFQAEGKDYERVDLQRTEIIVSIDSPIAGLDSVTGSCYSDDHPGSVCVATVTLPDTWFDYTEEDEEQLKLEAQVMYGTSLNELEELQKVTLETRLECPTTVDYAEMRVSVPSSVYYPSETVRVTLEGNAVYDVNNFLLECTMDEGYLQFVRVESEGAYILAASQNAIPYQSVDSTLTLAV